MEEEKKTCNRERETETEREKERKRESYCGTEWKELKKTKNGIEKKGLNYGEWNEMNVIQV